MTKRNPTKNWRNILWREWRHTDDEEYARYLFELVTNKSAIDWQTTTIIIGLGMLFGAGLGLVIAFITLFRTIEFDLNEWVTNLSTLGLFLAAGSLIGCGLGLLVRKNTQASFIWHETFFRLWLSGIIGLIYWLIAGPLIGILSILIINASLFFLTPEENYINDSIIQFFITIVIISVISTPIIGIEIGLTAGIIFAGMLIFRKEAVYVPGIDDILAKLKSTATQYEQRISPLIQQIFRYKHRRWYFWWHRQPKLIETKEALEQSTQILVEVRKHWTWALQYSKQSKIRSLPLDVHLSPCFCAK